MNALDQHVVPVNQDHADRPSCWCQPIVSYENPITGARVWLHRRAHDLPHREPARLAAIRRSA